MAASTGSPASRRSTKLTPLTTRPSLTSRQGITRTLNMQNSSIMIRSDQSDRDLIFLFEHDLRANAFRVCRQGKPVSTFPDHALRNTCVRSDIALLTFRLLGLATVP